MLAVGALAGPGWGDDRESKYSGTVVAVDRAGGTIVVEGMGPWQVKDGVTQVQRRTIGIKPSTAFVRFTRATGPAPSGWIGDFVESVLPGQQVEPGDWVTVTLKTEDERPTAVRVDVWVPSEG
jgi:hypothetical protein